MKRRNIFIGICVVAVAAHLLVLHQLPRTVMQTAYNRMMDQTGGKNRLAFAPRVSPQKQNIVRMSPDLSYAHCPVDVRDNAVRVVAAPWPLYMSLSVYAMNTDTLWLQNNVGKEGKPISVVLQTAGTQPGSVFVPGGKAVVIIRRLAPTQADYDAALRQHAGDECAKILPS